MHAALDEQIGRLRVELDWLKRKHDLVASRPQPVSSTELALMPALDEVYTAMPFYGAGQRLLRLMGIGAVGSRPRLSQAHRGHRVYPYLLRDVAVERGDEVWSCDTTYPRSDALTSWLRAAEVQNSMDGRGQALEERLRRAALALSEVRGGVPEGLRVGAGGPRRTGALLRLLQSWAPGTRRSRIARRRSCTVRLRPWHSSTRGVAMWRFRRGDSHKPTPFFDHKDGSDARTFIDSAPECIQPTGPTSQHRGTCCCDSDRP